MAMPGFTAEVSVGSGGAYRQVRSGSPLPDRVVPAIPPCHACGDILEECARGGLHGAICNLCATGFCDRQEWKNPDRYFTTPYAALA